MQETETFCSIKHFAHVNFQMNKTSVGAQYFGCSQRSEWREGHHLARLPAWDNRPSVNKLGARSTLLLLFLLNTVIHFENSA